MEPATYGLTPPAGFGCSTIANLRLMVADPRDLEEGRPLTPAHGDAALGAVRRYTDDKVKLQPRPTSPDIPDLETKKDSGPP